MACSPIIQHPVSAVRETLRSDPTRSHTRWHDSIDGGSRISSQPDLATTAPTPPTRLWKIHPYMKEPERSHPYREISKTFTGQAPKRETATRLKFDAKNSEAHLKRVHGDKESHHSDRPPSIIRSPHHVTSNINKNVDRVTSFKYLQSEASTLKGSVYSEPTNPHSGWHGHHHDTRGTLKAPHRQGSVIAPVTKCLSDAAPSGSCEKRSGKLKNRGGDLDKRSSNRKMEKNLPNIRRKSSPRAPDPSQNTALHSVGARLVTPKASSSTWRGNTSGRPLHQRSQNVLHEQSTGGYAGAQEEDMREQKFMDVVGQQEKDDQHNGADNEATSSSLSDADVSDYEPDVTNSCVDGDYDATGGLEARTNKKPMRNTRDRARGTTKRRHEPTGNPRRTLQDDERMATHSETDTLSPSKSETSTSSPDPQRGSVAEEHAARLRQEEEDRLLAIQLAKEDYNLRRPRQQGGRRAAEPTQEGGRGGRGSRRRG